MVTEVYKVTWTKASQIQIKKVHAYISKDSLQNADKVIDDILEVVSKIAKHPEIFSLDKYKRNNDGSYRAFEKHKYRISYSFKKEIIKILKVRHTKMKPLFY